MSYPFLGELRVFSFAFAPKGWAQCNGQTLQISQNTALFSLLGTQYGGDGIRTYALPDLRGRVALGFGNGTTQGQQLGSESHTLTAAEMPSHNHPMNATTSLATLSTPATNVFATGTSALYGSSLDVPRTLADGTVTSFGPQQPQPHDNRQPYLVINVCIALQGIFPARND